MFVYVFSSVLKRFEKSNLLSVVSQRRPMVDNLICPVQSNILRLAVKRYSEESSSNHTSLRKPVLRLLTKDNCSLCEEAKSILFSAPGCYSERIVLKEVDILEKGNEELFDLYRYEIPVFFLERKFISKNRIDLAKLDQELNNLEKETQI